MLCDVYYSGVHESGIFNEYMSCRWTSGKKKCIQFLSIHRCVSIYIMGSGSLQYQISYSENP